MKWIPTELHTHTLHSDGTFTVPELCACAKLHGYEMIALTDHNTLSGLEELSEKLARQTIPVIHGIEWTAYYGHMLVIDCQKYVDWREVSITDMDQKIRDVRENRGLVGIAHPYAIGSPLCTGCCWEYEVSAWDQVNYIEVWSGPFPAVHRGRNRRAEMMWQELLDRGYHIAATYGEDWHADVKEKEPWGCTFLAVHETAAADGVEALRRGRTMISMGPRPVAEIRLNGKDIYPGDTVPAGSVLKMTLGMDMNCRRGEWQQYDFRPQKVQILGRSEVVLAECVLCENAYTELTFTAPDSHFRIVYSGTVMGKECPIAFTSPYYAN